LSIRNLSASYSRQKPISLPWNSGSRLINLRLGRTASWFIEPGIAISFRVGSFSGAGPSEFYETQAGTVSKNGSEANNFKKRIYFLTF
jgi:hypothetical protein